MSLHSIYFQTSPTPMCAHKQIWETHISLSMGNRIPVCPTWPWIWQTVLAVSTLGIQARRTGGVRWTEEGRGKELTNSCKGNSCKGKTKNTIHVHARMPKDVQCIAFDVVLYDHVKLNVSSLLWLSVLAWWCKSYCAVSIKASSIDVGVSVMQCHKCSLYLPGYITSESSGAPYLCPLLGAWTLSTAVVVHCEPGMFPHTHTFTHFQAHWNIHSFPHRRSVPVLCHKSELSNRFYSS